MAANDYEERKAARIEQYRSRAENARQRSTDAYETSRRAVEHIPLGQPVLVGHHSEKRHRRDLERSHKAMTRSCDEAKKAEYWDRRANVAEKSQAVSGDDPDAIKKLEKKALQANTHQKHMKAVNAILRRKPKNELTPEKLTELAELDISESHARILAKPDVFGCVGYAGWELKNNNANIRRMKERIDYLKRHADDETSTENVGTVEIVDDVELNRVQMFFPGKPDDNIRRRLKGCGFRWCRTRGAWQAFRSPAALQTARNIAAELPPEP